MLLAEAEQLANIGSWELDVKRKRLVRSAHFYRMLGLPPRKAAVAHGSGMQLIHPEDQERGLRDLETLLSTGVTLDNELRFITADGAVRIFHSRAIAIRDKKGEIVLVRGMSQDVTESRAAETKLRESESLLSHAEEIAHPGSWEFDVGSSTTPTLSKTCARSTGYRRTKSLPAKCTTNAFTRKIATGYAES
jgi:PAS domain S-box-containing protein